jgi:hypothetical protein
MYEFGLTHHQTISTLRQKIVVTSMVLVVAMVGFYLANPLSPLQLKFHKFHYGRKKSKLLYHLTLL